MTEKVRYRLTLKERMDGTPFFMLEPRDRELSIIDERAWLGIELMPGTTYREAERVWKTLANIIDGLSYTVLPKPDDAA